MQHGCDSRALLVRGENAWRRRIDVDCAWNTPLPSHDYLDGSAGLPGYFEGNLHADLVPTWSKTWEPECVDCYATAAQTGNEFAVRPKVRKQNGRAVIQIASKTAAIEPGAIGAGLGAKLALFTTPPTLTSGGEESSQ